VFKRVVLAAVLVWVWGIGCEAAQLERPLRIISLSPAVTEILCALGEESHIVGVSSACDYPESILKKPKTGPFLSPQIETVLQLKPDLIITMGFEDSASTEQLKKTYLKTLTIPSPRSIEDIYQAIFLIGQATKRTKEALNLVRRLKSMVGMLSAGRSRLNPHKTLILVWGTPLIAASQHTFISDMVEKAGGKNVLDTLQPYPKLNPEMLYALNPDYIIVTDPSFVPIITQLPGLASLDAVKQKRILVMDASLFARPGPRFVLGLAALQREWRPKTVTP
jgi:iron complex transport system substrate-binding protein